MSIALVNDTDRGKPKYRQKSLSRYHSVHKKMDRYRFKPRPPRQQASY
jgi:hypothetical protein